MTPESASGERARKAVTIWEEMALPVWVTGTQSMDAAYLRVGAGGWG
jgi:hypothetical protein